MKAVLILVLSVVLVIECSRITKEHLNEGQEVIQSVPKSERQAFIAYALGHGFMEQNHVHDIVKFPFPTMLQLSKKQERNFQALEKPENFTSNLYQYVKSTFRLTSSDMFALILRRKICFPKGKCIDMENIGELCCPF